MQSKAVIPPPVVFDPPERAGSWLGWKVLGLVEVVVEVAGDRGWRR